MIDNRRSTSDGPTSTRAADNRVFIGTTERNDFWKNTIQAPYTKPTNIYNPGPGKYATGDKKKNDIKAKILNEETVKYPFNVSVTRDCNKPLAKSN